MTKLTLQARKNQETPGTRRRRLVPALLAASLLLRPFSLRPAEGPGWRLEEVLSIGGPKSDLLSMWVGLAVDADGSLYVTDNLQCSLMKFDSQGKLMKKAGRRGTGPGEFSAPRQVDVSAQAVYVVDAKIPAVQVFDKELNFQRRIPLPYAVQEIQALADGSLAMPGNLFLKTEFGKVIIRDQTGKPLRSMPFHPPGKKAVESSVFFIFTASGEMYTALAFLDCIAKVDAQGKPVWTKSLFDPAEVKAQYKTFMGYPRTLIYIDVALDPEGRLFVLGGKIGRNHNRDVYILSPTDGRLIGTLTLPQASHCLYLDRKGFLYSRADNGLTLKKYKIIAPPEKQ